MGRDKGINQGGSKQTTSLPTLPPISDEAKSISKNLVSQTSMSAEDQYKNAGALAKALGLSFKGHRPHGANHSKRLDGTKVIQNVLDGMTECANKAHIRNEIFQATGFRPD